jgi:hypothetical protein
MENETCPNRYSFDFHILFQRKALDLLFRLDFINDPFELLKRSNPFTPRLRTCRKVNAKPLF